VIPSLKELNHKYGDKGLTIIGVHSPEFDFEHDKVNVQQAIQRFGLPYRVVQDNDFANWNAYRNHYWPSLYLIDKEGYLRYNHIGEGDYDKIDAAVRQLLGET
jgi:redoxin